MTGGLIILMMRFNAPALLWLAALGVLSAQPSIRVNVDLAQIEAVVADAKGRHVPGLGIDDFRLTVDGKERRIAGLSYIDGGASVPVEGQLRREDVRRTIVFMLDETHTSSENMGQLVPVIKRFVDEQMGPHDLVSVMATRNNLGFFERFTSDKQQVRAALDRVIRLAGQHYDQINDQRASSYDRPGLVRMASHFMMEAYHGVAMAAIERALAGLRDMPGRKAVFLMSDGIEFPLDALNPRIGFPADPDVVFRMKRRTSQVAALAAQSGVVFYTFDLKTLDPLLMDPARRASMQTVPYLLAQETGGAFVQNTNGLVEAVGKAMDDMTGYYLISFTPTAEEARAEAADWKGRRIRVSVGRPELVVRARSSMRVAPPPATAAETREQAMRRAVLSPFAAGSMRLRVTPLYSASQPEKGKKRESLVRVLLSLDGRDLKWETSGTGKKAVLDVAVAAFAADNAVVGNRDQRFNIQVTDAQAAALSATEVDASLEFGALRPGPYQIRAAVRDDSTGDIGSAGIFLELPDFNQHRLTISSLVLSQAGESDRDTGTASRTFATGARLFYGCRLYGARMDKGAPRIDVEVRLFLDGRQIFASAPIPLTTDAKESAINVAGSVTLPAEFAAGEYTLQLTAHDRMPGGKLVSASQSTVLTLRPAAARGQ